MRNPMVKRIAELGMLTAVVIVLQLIGSQIHVGTFSISLVLVPIVVGAVLYGAGAGAWLGFVFGMVVLLSHDADVFLGVNVFGTILTVLSKGILAGAVAGFVSRAFQKSNRTFGTILAALVCPVVNTGVFLVACRVFFWETVSGWSAKWAADLGLSNNPTLYLFLVLAGTNFLIELGINAVLGPIIVKIVKLLRNS